MSAQSETFRGSATMRRYSAEETVDVVVIGTGAGGAPVLARLAQAGLSCVALEAGQWWEDPARDFATDETAQSKLYWLNERLSTGATPTAFGGNNAGTGVGGSTLHWGAFTPRADPRDLRLHREFGRGVDWPLSYDDLQPYYEEVERFIGVSGPACYPWDPARRYPLGPVPLNAPAAAMQRGFAALGLQTAEAPIAALSADRDQPHHGLRHACNNRGYCHQGCRNGAKASMDVTYLPVALAHGAEIRPQSMVHTLERDASGAICAVIYMALDGEGVPTGIEHRQRCRAVFLCAGAVETPRLLLHQPGDLANASGEVGRNFMAHVATQVWGTFPQLMSPNKGFPASLISEDLIRPKDADFVGGYLVQSLGIVLDTWGEQVARGRGLWGQALVDYLARFNSVAGIGINGDSLPDPANYLELSGEVDKTGLPKPRVHFSYNDNDRAMSRHAERVMLDAWAAAGATDTWVFQRSAHTIGTCRMGVDPSTSVVDPFGRAHDVPNLWIADNSVFPSALPANPALTIMALALRSADAFLRGR